MPIGTFSLVALECQNPHRLASFYAALTGGIVKDASESEDWVRLQIPGSSDIGFQRDLAYQPPAWPHGASQQAHLDFDVSDLDAAQAAVVELGATVPSHQPSPDEWRVCIDPAGHPFCLVKA